MSYNSTFQSLCTAKSPSRKNDVLAKALLLKSEKAGEKDKKEGLKLVSQALSFGSEELWDTLAKRRSQLWEEVGELKHALRDTLIVKNIDDDLEKRIVRLAESVGINCEGENDFSEKVKSIEEKLEKLLIENHKTQKVKSFSRHKTLAHFSDKVSIKNEAGRGRFLVAAKEIQPGELFALEKSYASLLGTET